MKHLQKAIEEFSKDALIGDEFPVEAFVETRGNEIVFRIQDGVIGEHGINGLQVTDMLKYIQHLYISLNEDFPCGENQLTINNIGSAINWQNVRTRERERRGVEGKNLP